MARKSSKATPKPSQAPTSKQGHPHKNNSESRTSAGLLVPKTILTYTLPPGNWPSSIPYLASNILSPELCGSSPSAASASTASETLHAGPDQASTSSNSHTPAIASPSTYTARSNPRIKLQRITDPTHPAHRQTGLFAAHALPAGSYIVDYTGLVHVCPRASCATSDYDLAFLERDAGLAIDSAAMGNEGRFVNDYHGVCERPNAVFEEYWVLTRDRGKMVWQARMGVWCAPGVGLQGIASGEEICVSYGKGWWRARRGLMEDGDVHEGCDVVSSGLS